MYLRNRSGFSLTEVMLAASMVTVIMVTLTMMTVQTSKTQKAQDVKAWLEQVSTQIEVHIMDDTAWDATIASNGNSLGCLDGGNCNNITQAINGDGYYPFEILNQRDGTVYFDSRAGQGQGFTNMGMLCDAFSEANGNSSCAFHVNFDWRPLDCPASGTCTPSRYNVRANFVYSPGDQQIPLNISRYNVNIIREREVAGGGSGGGGSGSGSGGGSTVTPTPTPTVGGGGGGNWWDNWFSNRGRGRGR